MDSPQHCRDQSAECVRLMKLSQSEAETQALKNLFRSWKGLAGQIDRYNVLIREQGRSGIRKEPLRHSTAAALTDEMLKIVARGVDKEDTA
jgi:hypothetical protein